MSLASRAVVASLAAALGVTAACGSSRPPLLGDGDDAGPPDTGQSLVGDSATVIQNCGTGPDGGVCACADEPLLGDVPNIYFVLDRSGSMNDLGKWGTVQSVLARLVIGLGPRASVGAAVFPDPAQDGCAPGVQVFATMRGDAPAGKPGPAELALLEALGHVPAAGGTPTAATLTALAPTIEGLHGKTYLILATDGGPNCNTGARCTADQCTDNIESVTGCPPGGPPDCCTDPNFGAGLSCLDSQPTIDAVSAIAKAGIPVYVMGVPGSAPYANLLDQMAQAGGTARGSEPQYYAVDTADQGAFYTAMSNIAAKITGSCTLTLNNAPPDPGLLNVYLDEQPLAQSGPDGWALNGTLVTILGASCQRIMAGDVLDVRVVAGCPTVTQ